MAGREQEALQQAQRTVELDSHISYAHWEMGYLLAMTGKYPEALVEAKKAHDLSPANTQLLAQVGFIYARWGKHPEALSVLHQLKGMSKASYVDGYDWALLYSALGEKDKAFAWLEKGLNHTPGE